VFWFVRQVGQAHTGMVREFRPSPTVFLSPMVGSKLAGVAAQWFSAKMGKR
jgi:hypothetical protein